MQYSAGDQFECFRHNGTYATVLFSLLKFVFFVFFLKIVFFSQKCVFFELCVFCVCFSQNHAKRLCFVCVSFLNTLACVCFVCVFVLMPSPANNQNHVNINGCHQDFIVNSKCCFLHSTFKNFALGWQPRRELLLAANAYLARVSTDASNPSHFYKFDDS